MSQSELARRAGVSVTVVKRYELGETNPHIDTLEKLVVAFKAVGVIFLAETQAFKTGVGLT
jgi:transcriptional regulator with XRE-family HTH domain